MNVRIGEYLIISDRVSLTLYQIRTRGEGSKSKGKEYKIVVGYFTSVLAAFNRLIEHRLMVSDAKDIRTLIEIVKDTKLLIKKSINGTVSYREEEEINI